MHLQAQVSVSLRILVLKKLRKAIYFSKKHNRLNLSRPSHRTEVMYISFLEQHRLCTRNLIVKLRM